MPIFLPRKPETQPRVVCFCQPVWAMISAIVAPPLRFSIAMTSSLLLLARAVFGSPDSLAFCLESASKKKSKRKAAQQMTLDLPELTYQGIQYRSEERRVGK